MKRLGRLGAVLLLVAAGAAALSMPTTAKGIPASELKMVATGQDGVAATGVVCERVRHARLCFEGNKPTCPAGACF